MIRKTKTSDAQQIEALMKSVHGFWDNNWRQRVIGLGIEASKDLTFVYKKDNAILGFICAHDCGFRAYLSELVVSPQMQNSGIGKKLIRKVEQELTRRKCKIFIADVWRDSEGFYKKLGWVKPKVVFLRKKL